jgi:hypothetical protein
MTSAPEPAEHRPSSLVGDRWHNLALLALSIATGRSRAFTTLRSLANGLDGCRVMGVLDLNSPCIRLKRLALKAAFAPDPSSYFAALGVAAEGVIALHARLYAANDGGGEHV